MTYEQALNIALDLTAALPPDFDWTDDEFDLLDPVDFDLAYADPDLDPLCAESEAIAREYLHDPELMEFDKRLLAIAREINAIVDARCGFLHA